MDSIPPLLRRPLCQRAGYLAAQSILRILRLAMGVAQVCGLPTDPGEKLQDNCLDVGREIVVLDFDQQALSVIIPNHMLLNRHHIVRSSFSFVPIGFNYFAVKSDEYILKRYRGMPPSLIIHLHPAHFRFDQQEGSFSYKSPMKIMIEHLKLRTIPHDLADFFADANVPFYEGCMIVQIVDHKSTAPAPSTARADTGTGKAAPFSIHNSNAYLTPSPYVPFPIDNQTGKSKVVSTEIHIEDGKTKSSEQKDKENMPAPAIPVDGQRGRVAALPKKPKTTTIVLHPTPVSAYTDLQLKAGDARSNSLSGRDPRADINGPLSATVPPTPVTAIPPPTPMTSMAAPAKRQKRMKAEIDCANIHELEAQITLVTTAPLVLDTVKSAAESAALLQSLAHPMHTEKPPSPKTRKRTVAEMAADEALAAEQERYVNLILIFFSVSFYSII
jgi:transcription factor SPT20